MFRYFHIHRAGLVIALLLAFGLCGGMAHAADDGSDSRASDQRPAFFTVLNDVPLMAGLTEMPGETVVFDKPEGRIVESLAYTEEAGPSAADIESFYNRTLPHLGWQRVGQGTFLRQDEVLRFEVETEDGGQQVLVTVMPRH